MDIPTTENLYALHRVKRFVVRGIFRADPGLVCHDFMFRAPAEMMSAKTGLANTPGTFRTAVVSICMCENS
jgi:hypothetical protein